MSHAKHRSRSGVGVLERELAEVAVGGMPVGYAVVEVGPTEASVTLAAPGLLRSLLSQAAEAKAGAPCTCRADELAPARIRSLSGDGWSLGVKVCMAHRCLHRI